MAISQFAERGLRSTSIAAVARDAGVSPASVFGYFGSKEELFYAAADLDATHLIEETAVGFLGVQPEIDFHERWTHLWEHFSTALIDHPLLRRMMLDPEMPVFPRMLDLPSVKAGVEVFAEEIRVAQASGIVRPDVDPFVGADGLSSLMIALVLTHDQMGVGDQPERLEGMLAVLNSALRRALPVDGGPGVESPAPRDGATPAEPEALTTQSKGERTRERILEVAVSLFSVNGSKGTSVAQIARQVGITPAAVFAHFASKDELFDAALNHNVEAMILAVGDRSGFPDNPAGFGAGWAAVIGEILERADEFPLFQRFIEAREISHSRRLLESPSMRSAVEILEGRITVALAEGRARNDLEPALLAQGLIDLTACVLVAQSHGNVDPPGLQSRLDVIAWSLSPEVVSPA